MRTIIITGANSGIGLETARALAQQGERVVLACRSASRGQAALDTLRTALPAAHLSLELVDTGSLASIRAFVTRIESQFDQLHVLVNNAGAFFNDFSETDEGIEQTFAVNHLGYFRLTLALERLLLATPVARVVNVSSGAHFMVRQPPHDWQSRQRYAGFAAYAQSKFANVLFTYHLAQRWLSSGVTANCLHPGLVATNFGSNNGWVMGVAMKLAQLFSLNAVQGAKTSIYLASSAAVAAVTGKYFDNSAVRQSSPLSYDKTLQQALWDYSLGFL